MSIYFNEQQENLNYFLDSEKRAEYYGNIIINLDYNEQNNFFLTSEITKTQKVVDENFNEIEFTPKHALDTVLDHYCKLFLGITCGYFPLNLDYEFTEKIIRFLELQTVRKYYKSKYKYFLPQAVVGYCFAIQSGDKSIFRKNNELTKTIFNDFIIIHRAYSQNKNIQNFISIIDDFDNFEIEKYKLISKFKSVSTIQSVIANNEESTTFIGAIQLLDFFNELSVLIEKCQKFEIVQSIIWHFYGYLLETRKSAVESFYFQMLDEYQNSISEYDFNNLKDTGIENINEIKSRSISLINNSVKNLKNLLDDRKFSTPLRKYVKTHLSRSGACVSAN